MAWAKNGTPDTLGSAGDQLTISDQTSTTFNQILSHVINTGTINYRFQVGNGSLDTSGNYSERFSNNGGVDFINLSQAYINGNVGNDSIFGVLEIMNISGEEKLAILHTCERFTAGAANAPHRIVVAGKWANTSVQFDNVGLLNTSGGSFDTDSNLSALGTD